MRVPAARAMATTKRGMIMIKASGVVVLLLFFIGCASPEPGASVGPRAGDGEWSEPTLAAYDEAAPEGSDQGSVSSLAGGTTQATCTARCGSLPPVSCTGTTCGPAVDRDCASGQQGYVECNGVRKSCPACACMEGAERYVQRSGCCCNWVDPTSGRVNDLQVCSNGTWVTQDTVCVVSGAACDILDCPI